MDSPSLPILPGISAEYLSRAKVAHIDVMTAVFRCRINAAGILFPYFNLQGEVIEELGDAFYRLRLDEPRGDRKYHQRSGTRPHAYLPPSIWDNGGIDSIIYVVEGEKKALSLSEAGFCSVGIGGFYNFSNGNCGLVEELEDVLGYAPADVELRYLGDRDVLFNPQFCHAACALRGLMTKGGLSVACLPFDAPGKGVDDCRHMMGAEFSDWFSRSISYLPVEEDGAAAAFSVALVEQNLPALKLLTDEAQRDAAHGLVKLAAALTSSPLEQARLIEIGERDLGQARAVLKKLVKAEGERMRADFRAAELAGETRAMINLSSAAGDWTREVFKIIGPRSYVFAGNLCELHDTKFQQLTAASLVSFLENADCCGFVKESSGGSQLRYSLKECDTRVLVGAVKARNFDLLRPVEVLAQTPVLVCENDAATLVTGYNAHHKILAPEGDVALPSPETASSDLRNLLRDFRFCTPGDTGAALALFLSPALARGKFLGSGRVPFFFVVKDHVGAGGSTLVRMVAACFGMKPATITPQDPKAAREDLSKHLLIGANFICLDNVKGNILSKVDFLESMLTEPEFTGRAPYTHGTVNVERCVIAGTSNGAVLSEDLADRTVRISIQKQPTGYQFHKWSEGDLMNHVHTRCHHYLGCIYSLITDWAGRGQPDGPNLTGFRFSQWESACSWILDHHFHLPLLDVSHKAAQLALASPDHDFLKSLFRHLIKNRSFGPHTASSLTSMAMEADLMPAMDVKGASLRMGKILARELPKTAGCFTNEFLINRLEVKNSNSDPITNYYVLPNVPIA